MSLLWRCLPWSPDCCDESTPHVLSCRRGVPRQHDLLRERAVSSYCRNESRCAARLARGMAAVAVLAGGWCCRRAAHRATEGSRGIDHHDGHQPHDGDRGLHDGFTFDDGLRGRARPGVCRNGLARLRCSVVAASLSIERRSASGPGRVATTAKGQGVCEETASPANVPWLGGASRSSTRTAGAPR